MSGITLVALKEILFDKDLRRNFRSRKSEKIGKSNTRNDRLATSPTSGVLTIFGHL